MNPEAERPRGGGAPGAEIEPKSNNKIPWPPPGRTLVDVPAEPIGLGEAAHMTGIREWNLRRMAALGRVPTVEHRGICMVEPAVIAPLVWAHARRRAACEDDELEGMLAAIAQRVDQARWAGASVDAMPRAVLAGALDTGMDRHIATEVIRQAIGRREVAA